MHKLMAAIGAAALLAASSVAAFAAEASGQIASIDEVAGTITLADGSIYYLPSAEALAQLQVGQAVTVTFEMSPDGQLLASDVVPAM
jgi:hypothetical protein